jgi:hypothetical protein
MSEKSPKEGLPSEHLPIDPGPQLGEPYIVAASNQVTGSTFTTSSLRQETTRRELPEEVASRLRREEDDAAAEREMAKRTHLALLIAGGAIMLLCIGVILWPGTEKTAAWAILTAIVGLLAGYFGGSKTAK